MGIIKMSTEIDLNQKIVQKAWEDSEFKKELLENPKVAIQKFFQIPLPENIEIKVLEETPSLSYLVLPVNPVEVANPDEPIPDCGW